MTARGGGLIVLVGVAHAGGLTRGRTEGHVELRIVSEKAAGAHRGKPPAPTTKAARADEKAGPGLPRGPGRALDAGLATEMSKRFGERFDDVRVHSDGAGAASAAAAGAAAYTFGRDMVFARGQYAPATAAGRDLVAHELAHVVQQRRAGDGDGASVEAGARGAVRALRESTGRVHVAGASRLAIARQTPEEVAREERERMERQRRTLDTMDPSLRKSLEQFGIAPPRTGPPSFVWLGEKPREELRQIVESSAPVVLDSVRRGRPIPPLRAAPPPPTGDATRDFTNNLNQQFQLAGLQPIAGPGQQQRPIDPAVPGQAKQVSEELDKFLTSPSAILQVFRSANERQFVELQDKVPISKVLDTLGPWDVVQLGTYGPIVSSTARKKVNDTRAEFLADKADSWGPVRAEIFALYFFSTMTDDDTRAVLRKLAADQQLAATVGRMPTLTKLISDRIDIHEFKDRGWKAADILTGVANFGGKIVDTIPIVQDAKGMAAINMAHDLPEPYQTAVFDADMAAVAQALTPGNILFGTADYATLGLLSGVKGVVYDAPRAVISGVGQISQGNVAGGVEQLTGGAIAIIGAILGVRAFRKSARIAAMLELTTEGKALYEGLSKSIGRSGMDRVAGYARASAEAQILIREEGAEAIEALHASRGNVAAARQALLSRRGVPVGPPQPTPQMLAAIGEPAGTSTNRVSEHPYTNPPGTEIYRGRPLDFSKLDPKKTYIWAVNEQGDFLLVAEQHEPAAFGPGRRVPGQAKHGDLIPGPGGTSRGPARAQAASCGLSRTRRPARSAGG